MKVRECDDNYLKSCYIAYEKAAVKVPLRICKKPLVKDCSSDKVRHQTFLVTKVVHLTFLVTKVGHQTFLAIKVAHQTFLVTKVAHQSFLATKVAHQTFLVTKVVNQTFLVTKVAHQTSKLRMKHYCKKDVSQNIPFHRMF